MHSPPVSCRGIRALNNLFNLSIDIEHDNCGKLT